MLHLIAGGAGFLGSHLANALVEEGEDVIIVDNLSTGHIRNLERSISSGHATFVYADVAVSGEKLDTLVRRATNRNLSRIYHLASPASPEAYGRDPWGTLVVNSLGTMALIELALAHEARFLFASTSEVYGDPLVHPQPEDYFGNVDPIGPRSCYDEGKRFGEAATAAATRARGLDARLVRFFNCYGPCMDAADGRLIPELIDAIHEVRPMPIHGDGSQTRSMTFVDDAISLLLVVMERPMKQVLPVNIGSNDERTVEEIARALARVAGVEFRARYLPPREGDPQRRRPDLCRARGLGWSPSTSLDDGLRITYRWFTQERLAFA